MVEFLFYFPYVAIFTACNGVIFLPNQRDEGQTGKSDGGNTLCQQRKISGRHLWRQTGFADWTQPVTFAEK